MNLWNAVVIGLKEIWAHKFRSLLTMLGIILGVSSLVAMSALVKGMENGMKEALIAIGGLEKVRVEQQDIPAAQKYLEDQAVGSTIHDVYALQRSAPLIKLVSPEMRISSGGGWGSAGAIITHGVKTLPERVQLVGTWPSAIEMNQHVIQYGRMFNEFDDENARNVCVIGTNIRDQLFGAPETVGREIVPLGENININTQPFRIIGMFEHYESEQDRKLRELEKNLPKQIQTGPERRRGWGTARGGPNSWVYSWKNSTIYIPLNTMWIKFRSGGSGTNSVPDPRLSSLDVKVADIDLLEPALQQAKNVMMHTHKGIEDFAFRTQENWGENITTAIRNQRMSGGFISAISLLVGGIGIMNIMLASITERIREIGIRKAVGATHVSVFVQILIESVVISLLGGVAGLVTSYGLVHLLTVMSPTENTPIITFNSMGLAFLLSACVGVLAGLIPAFKAAKLDPIQALRYE
jgi:putative ABC transport system permease protein